MATEQNSATFAGLRLAGGNLVFKDGKFAIAGDWKQNSYGKTYGKKEGSTYFNWHEAMSANVDGWRFPTRKEWKDIIGTDREGSVYNGQKNACFALVDVIVSNGDIEEILNGLILFPDGKEVRGVEIFNINKTYKNTGYYKTRGITENQLNILLKQGCVFLPASGYYDDGGGWGDGGDCGYYWSSTEDNGDDAYCLYFDGSYLYADSRDGRVRNYYSVRLVRE